MTTDIVSKFSKADTSEKLRAITISQIKSKASDTNTLHAEKMQRRLLLLADEKELIELEKVFSPVIRAEFPGVIVEAVRTNKYPCILIWPKGKEILEEIEE